MRGGPRLLVVAGSLVGLAFLTSAPADPIVPKPGQVTEISHPPLAEPLLLWLPGSHGENPDRLWPVCLYYHGTKGAPTLHFALEAAGRENWILIGMTYRESGRFQGSRENVEAERQIYQDLLEEWDARYSLGLDPGRVFVAGFSKGGWVAGLFVESDPRLAGAVILGAGLLDRPGEPRRPRPIGGKPVYFGLGEKDGNVAMSFRGVEILEKDGARVTWDLWEGIGHAIPAKAPVFLQQWFDREGAESGSLAVRSDAVEWMEAERARIRALESPVDRWEALDVLSRSPWRDLADAELDAEIVSLQSEVAAREDLVEEREAREAYLRILEAESANRWVETLRVAHDAYEALALAHPETRWGKRAAVARDRTASLLP